MANILHVVNSFDPAGDVVRSVAELKKYSVHSHEVIVKDRHDFQGTYQFPEAALMPHTCDWNNLVPHLINWSHAIVYHFVGMEDGVNHQGFDRPCAFRNSNIYLNSDGRFFPVAKYHAKDISKYNLLASSHLAAEDFMPGCKFLPAMIPVEDMLYTPLWSTREHSLAYIKHTGLINTDSRLIPKRLNLRDMKLSDVLMLRRSLATITLDNVSDGHYGLAGMEALSQGIPVIVRNEPVTQKQLWLMSEKQYPPFFEVKNTIEAVEVANKLVMDVSRRAFQALRIQCRQWAERYYHSQVLVKRFWDPFCDELLKYGD